MVTTTVTIVTNLSGSRKWSDRVPVPCDEPGHTLWFMPVTKTPGALALGNALRDAHYAAFPPAERRGSVRRVAKAMGLSHSAISQWHSGDRIPAVEDVARYLTNLGITGGDTYDRIMEIARKARDRNWVTTGLPGVSQALSGILECERTCNALTVWAPLYIPGLLQTGDYARAIMANRNRPLAEIETRVKLRVGRRETLTRRNAPEYVAFIGEQALRQNIGGPEVMADQLRSALALDRERANVALRVVPIGGGAHDGLSGAFELFEFPDKPPIVLLEHFRSSLFLSDDDNSDDVEAFKREAVENLHRVSLSAEDSLTLIDEIAQEYERTG